MTAQFADDPAAYFGYDAWEVHQHPREKIEALQLTALQSHFAALKDIIPPLRTLSAMQVFA